MKQPQILILDEPTSNYDSDSKTQFLSALDEITCTSIIIAHDLEILKVVDQIILLDNGEAKIFENFESYVNSNFYREKENEL